MGAGIGGNEFPTKPVKTIELTEVIERLPEDYQS